MYILLENNKVKQIIPDIDPTFPDVPIDGRYTAKFVASLMHVDDTTEVTCGMAYNAETGGFYVAELPEYYPTVTEEASDTADTPVTWDELAAAYTEGVNSIDE